MTGKAITQNEFIFRAVQKHGDKFDYSRVIYTNSNSKIEVGCKQCGIFFFVRPAGHLQGNGCKKCAMIALCSPNPPKVLFERYLKKSS